MQIFQSRTLEFVSYRLLEDADALPNWRTSALDTLWSNASDIDDRSILRLFTSIPARRQTICSGSSWRRTHKTVPGPQRSAIWRLRAHVIMSVASWAQIISVYLLRYLLSCALRDLCPDCTAMCGACSIPGFPANKIRLAYHQKQHHTCDGGDGCM